MTEREIKGAELPDLMSIDSDIVAQVEVLTHTVNQLIEYVQEQEIEAELTSQDNSQNDTEHKFHEDLSKRLNLTKEK